MLDPTRKRQVGVFLPNVAPGNIPSTAATRNPLSFDALRRHTMQCQRAEVDFVLMMSKFRGFGGATGFWDASLEAMTITAGLLATVPEIGIVPTVATHVMHPSAIARQLAAFDSISPRRVSINLAAGWAPREFAQSGLQSVSAADARQAQADALSVLRLLLNGNQVEPLNYEGQLVRIFDGVLDPKPEVPPYLMVPGASEATIELASEKADLLLTSGIEAVGRAATLKSLGAEKGRQVGTVIVRTVVPEATTLRAKHRLQALNDATDRKALQALHKAAGPNPTGNRLRVQSKKVAIDPETAIIGTSSEIAESIDLLLSTDGVAGICVQMDNYEDDLQLFCEDIMPLLRSTSVQG